MGTEGYTLRRPGLLWRGWDGEIVVYSDLSGDTHHLDPLAAEVFEALIEAPSDLDGLTARVAGALALEPTEDLRQALDAIVQNFAVHGLLEPRV